MSKPLLAFLMSLRTLLLESLFQSKRSTTTQSLRSNPRFCFLSTSHQIKHQILILTSLKSLKFIFSNTPLQNTRPDESQAGIKIAQRNINNLRYVDDTTLMAESKEDLKSLLMKVKEESEKVGLKLNIRKN